MKSSPISASEKRVILAENEILRLERKSRVREIRVVTGRVWLTETPADSDIILGMGETRRLGMNGPFILQALEPVEMILLPEPSEFKTGESPTQDDLYRCAFQWAHFYKKLKNGF
jgi:hypothetical protein